MPEHDSTASPNRSDDMTQVLADAITPKLPTSFLVTSADGAAIPSGTALVSAKSYELRSTKRPELGQGQSEQVRLEVHLVSEKARVPEVEEAIIRLLTVAQSDTDQSRIVADFLLAWRNADQHGGFAVSDMFSLDGALARDIATIVTHLSRCSTAVYADVFGHEAEMAILAERWRGTAIQSSNGRGRTRDGGEPHAA